MEKSFFVKRTGKPPTRFGKPKLEATDSRSSSMDKGCYNLDSSEESDMEETMTAEKVNLAKPAESHLVLQGQFIGFAGVLRIGRQLVSDQDFEQTLDYLTKSRAHHLLKKLGILWNTHNYQDTWQFLDIKKQLDWPIMDQWINKAYLSATTGSCSEKEFKRLTVLKGFVYEAKIRELSQLRKSCLSFSDGKIEETPRILAHGDLISCSHCCVNHQPVVHPLQCSGELKARGPLFNDYLKVENWLWDQIEVVMVGESAFRYIPPNYPLNILNMGITRTTKLSTVSRDNFSPIHQGENSFWENLREKLDSLGFDNSVPVLIEYPIMANQGILILDVLVGFLNVLLDLQKQYWGPLIAVIPPYRYHTGETGEQYRQGALRHRHLSELATLVGQIMGVPVFTPVLQALPYHSTETRWHLRYPWWRNEPLYTKDGNVTKENMRRWSTELSAITAEWKKYRCPLPVVEHATQN
jgi:hypothetical protein